MREIALVLSMCALVPAGVAAQDTQDSGDGAAADESVGEAADQDAAADEPELSPEEAEARVAFTAGTAAFEAGRFGQALRDFSRAYELSGRAELLYNVGLAHDRLRHDREALEAFEAFLDADPASIHRPRVEARLRSLREAMAAEEHDRTELEAQLAEARTRSVFEQWWFWTIAGAVLAGSAVATVLILTAEDEIEPALPGTQGAIHMLLRSP